MNGPENSESVKRWPPTRVFLWGFCALFALYVLMMVSGPFFSEMLVLLPVGWIYFCIRALPETKLNWDLLGMALLSLAVGRFVLHQFMRWASGQVAKSRGNSFVWPGRWTVCCVAGIGVLFVIGASVSGIKQQVEWIKQSDAPTMVLKSPHLGYEMQFLATDMFFEIEDGKADYQAMRTKFRAIDGTSLHWSHRPAINHFHGFGIFEGEKCNGVLIFPRDEMLRAKYGGILMTPTEKDRVNEEKLKEILSKYRDNLRSF